MSASLLIDVVEPVAECLTAEAARKIVNLRADPKLQARVDELAGKANEGTLSERDKAEYDQYLAAYHFVSILQARARRFLSSCTWTLKHAGWFENVPAIDLSIVGSLNQRYRF